MEIRIRDITNNFDLTRGSASTLSTTTKVVSDMKVNSITTTSGSETTYEPTSPRVDPNAPTDPGAHALTDSGSMSNSNMKKVADNNVKVKCTANSNCNKSSENNVRTSKGMKLLLDDLVFVKRLGSGDIGTVYLVELKGIKGCLFAAKVMDKEELAYRSKEGRAGTEREILEMLEHPFLPSLYATMDCPRWSCLLTEFCPGGDLHVLRQCQPEKRFHEDAVRFYASEVVAALEYLHMLDVVYRDLKPENVLVRSDGHITLTDFDLSLKCDDSTSTARLVYDRTDSKSHPSTNDHELDSSRFSMIPSCILPKCIVPRVSCIRLGQRRIKKGNNARRATLKIVAEPVEARSMSFVGTHEYLAPEIVSGEGHGNAVDWWTLGIFMYELFYGVTPFRGMDNECTLANIVARGLEFPKEPTVSPCARDLMSQLLNKGPSKRMGSFMGATAIKQHPFFEGVNWALLRCTKPPYVPSPFNLKDLVSSRDDNCDGNIIDYY